MQYGDQATFNEATLSVLSHLTDAVEWLARGKNPGIMTDIKAARVSLAIMERLTDPTRDDTGDPRAAAGERTGEGEGS